MIKQAWNKYKIVLSTL